MEKPNFFKMAIDRNLYLAAPEAAEMCEHVWDTHVVPLQEKWENQKITIREFQEGLHKITGTAISYFSEAEKIFNQLESENKALQEKLKIAEHLKELADDAIVTLHREVEKLKADNESLLKGALDNIKKHMHH